MKEIQLARRYALALFTVARETNLTSEVAADFEQLLKVIAENRDFRVMLQSPVIPSHKKKAIMTALFGSHIHDISLRFMNLLAHNGREKYLNVVAGQVVELYREFMGIVRITVVSAQPLNPSNRQELVAKLRQVFGDRTELLEKTEPSLLGGFVLEWGDQRYDASLLKEVKELRKEFEENLYVRQF
ncbi:MAG: ATP synthase F1 subunit delta [Bacteroidales bacterium]|jgi:F-type H+-transporting ATPase subunit delta|nr:ATP synthase F1 subunit delta [Bacteroidales bacterium]MDD3664263.1 ATP synthase F1 subunit delta [Bacteroidales bacterium]